MTPDLSLVICTLNEAESIGTVVREALAQLEGWAVEVIVVDDSPDDQTAKVVLALAGEDMRVRLIRRHGERGLATAAAAGWRSARGRILGLMDGDGQHDPAVLPRLLRALDTSDADIAVGSRYALGGETGLQGFRHVLSRCGTGLVHSVTGAPTTDPLSGLFLFRRSWWLRAERHLSPVGYKILLDVALSGGRKPKVAEVPTRLRHRLGGRSKLDCRIIFELFAQIVEKRTRGVIPARFVLFGSVGSSGLFVHSAVAAGLILAETPFWFAQGLATIVAMTSNFLLNNLLTFRDQRLGGAALWRGLGAFYLACSSGALFNQVIALILHSLGVWPIAASLAGAIAAAVWNFNAASRLAWNAGRSSAPDITPPTRSTLDRSRTAGLAQPAVRPLGER